eukprot:72111-Pyramimonas_sp.AAC.1
MVRATPSLDPWPPAPLRYLEVLPFRVEGRRSWHACRDELPILRGRRRRRQRAAAPSLGARAAISSAFPAM